MEVRGIRGATTVDKNERNCILEATRELLDRIIKKNNLDLKEIAAVFFTTTPDLNDAFPAAAAREMGWNHVPLFCSTEIAVPDGIPRCIRVLFLVNTSKSQDQVHHVYLNNAVNLRPDLTAQ